MAQTYCTLGNITNKVSALISDMALGDTVFLIDSHLPNALKTVCKMVAETKPIGNEHLLVTTNLGGSLVATDEDDAFYLVSLSDVNPVFTKGVFNKLYLQTSTYYRGYPVHSVSALRLATTHEVFYYYWDGTTLRINASAAMISAFVRLVLTHYTYATITQFPVELEDYLVMELVRLIQNEGAKQAVEAQKI